MISRRANDRRPDPVDRRRLAYRIITNLIVALAALTAAPSPAALPALDLPVVALDGSAPTRLPHSVVVLVWASWCVACRAEIERFAAMKPSAAPLATATLALDPAATARYGLSAAGLTTSRAYATTADPAAVLAQFGGQPPRLPLAFALDARSAVCGVDLVIGAKGSPLQIILSALFQIDQPTGNIPLAEVERLQHNRLISRAVPVSLGDNLLGYRIVGTSPAYGDLYGARLASGRWWTTRLEAILGSEVARATGLHVGQVFVGEHGLARGGERHAHSPYRVTGILLPTGAVINRLALTDTASVWSVHERENAKHAAAVAAIHEAGEPDTYPTVGREPDTYPTVGREVTALLVQYRSAMGALMLPRLIKASPALQAAVPALEVARLTKMLGTGSDVLRGFGIGLLGLSALGFFVALLGAVQARQKSLALLRALGARPALLTGLVLGEGALLGVLGGVSGLVIGRVAAGVALRLTADGGGPALNLPAPGRGDLAVVAAAVALSLVAALVPAMIAYRLDPARVLRS